VGWHVAFDGEEAANLITSTASGSVGCGLHLLPALVSVPRRLIFKLMILYRAVNSMFYLNLKSDFGMHTLRRFLKWQLLSLKRAVSPRRNCIVLISVLLTSGNPWAA